jgi:hypothetical protein
LRLADGYAVLLAEDRGDGLVIVTGGQPPDEADDVLAGALLGQPAAYLVHRHRQVRGGAALPDDRQVRGPGADVDGDDDLADHGAQQLLALDDGGGGRVEHGLDISAGPGDPGQCTGGERDRLAGLLGTQAVLGLPDGR